MYIVQAFGFELIKKECNRQLSLLAEEDLNKCIATMTNIFEAGKELGVLTLYDASSSYDGK